MNLPKKGKIPRKPPQAHDRGAPRDRQDPLRHGIPPELRRPALQTLHKPPRHRSWGNSQPTGHTQRHRHASIKPVPSSIREDRRQIRKEAPHSGGQDTERAHPGGHTARRHPRLGREPRNRDQHFHQHVHPQLEQPPGRLHH